MRVLVLGADGFIGSAVVAALQDPELPLLGVLGDARGRAIVVNAVYCGADDGGPVARSWQEVAQHGDIAGTELNCSRIAWPQERRRWPFRAGAG